MSLILPGCGGTSALARGETLGARWFHEPQPITSQYGSGFHTVRGGIDPWDHHFRPRFVGVAHGLKDF